MAIKFYQFFTAHLRFIVWPKCHLERYLEINYNNLEFFFAPPGKGVGKFFRNHFIVLPKTSYNRTESSSILNLISVVFLLATIA